MNDFAKWFGEIHVTNGGVEVTRSIASHLPTRIQYGDAVIVCRNPQVYSSVFSKRWKDIIRRAEKERATKVGGNIKEGLTAYINDLKTVKFIAEQPQQRYLTTVWLVEPDEAAELPKHIASIYVMTDVSIEQLAVWAQKMEAGGFIQTYRKTSFGNIREAIE